MSVLSIRGLRVGFAGQGEHAVDGVDLDVAQGEIVALVGESGSGKSVTAKAVLGLLPDTASVTGSVRLADREVLGADETTLRAVRGAQAAMVFQEPATALNPVETVGWQLIEAQRAHRRVARAEARRRAVELLELVGIPDPATRVGHYPHQLSGGQRQRVVIALALANEPALIIADEPTTALDVTVQAEILRLLRELRDRTGTAILLITHNMGVVADLADRVVVLRDGSVVETSGVDDLFARPRAAYTKELLASVPSLEDARPDGDLPVADGPSAAPPHQATLSLRDLVVEYPGRLGRPAQRAIDGVELSLAPGEVVGLVGESGSGKSTLGRVAVGLLAPLSGHAELLGHDLRTIRAGELQAVRRRIGMVFQDPAASLDPLRTVGDAIGEPLLLHRVAKGKALRDRVAELLTSVRLPAGYADRRPAELSGGQRQRVGLARALALEPDLVVADEPTSALDVTVQAAVLELFRELQHRLGFACLFISHDLAVVDEICDRVVLLRHGRVVEQGLPSAVLRSPTTEYARQLVASVPVPDPARQRARRASVEDLRV